MSEPTRDARTCMCVAGVTMRVGHRVKVSLSEAPIYGTISGFEQVYPGTEHAFWLVTIDVDPACRTATMGCRYFGAVVRDDQPPVTRISLLD